MTGRWPYLQGLAVTWLEAQTGKRTATRRPDDIQTRAADGFYRVARGPGSDDGVTDSPLLDVEAFGTSEDEAFDLAEDARQALLALRGRAVGGALVDRVTTAVGPVLVDFGNPAVVRVVASYRFEFRKQFT